MKVCLQIYENFEKVLKKEKNIDFNFDKILNSINDPVERDVI